MKKAALVLLVCCAYAGVAAAQSDADSTDVPKTPARLNNESTYNTALGLRMFFGGPTAGITLKHFIIPKNAVEVGLLFPTSGGVILEGLYEYQGSFQETPGLYWYGGAGLLGYFTEDEQDDYFGLPLAVGLEYKLKSAPLVFGFDWQPLIWFSEGVDNQFDASNVGVTVRVAFR